MLLRPRRLLSSLTSLLDSTTADDKFRFRTGLCTVCHGKLDGITVYNRIGNRNLSSAVVLPNKVINRSQSQQQKQQQKQSPRTKSVPNNSSNSNNIPDNKNPKKSTKPLCNEDLIRYILSKKPSCTVNTVQIRLVLDSSLMILQKTSSSSSSSLSPSSFSEATTASSTPSAPPTVQVISLSQAIQTATEYEVDLLAINLEQDPPVIKAVNLQKLLYKESKKNSSSGPSSSSSCTSSSSAGSNSGPKAVKEFQFKTCIEGHDLERKVENMIAYLKKGHACQVILQHHKMYSNRWKSSSNISSSPTPTSNTTTINLDNETEQIIVMEETPIARQNRLIIEDMITKLRSLVGNVGQVQGNPKMNEEKTRCTLYYQPQSHKK